jgi:hypothetical protein
VLADVVSLRRAGSSACAAVISFDRYRVTREPAFTLYKASSSQPA